MMETDALLEKIQSAVSQHRSDTLQESIDTAFDAGIKPADVRRAIMQGLERVRLKLMSNETSIPDFLLCIDTMNLGLNHLSARKGDQDDAKNGPSVVIGVVEGDPHDIGKNIIAAIYRAYGFQVVDLGFGVPKEKFIQSVVENSSLVLALSGMMSTTVTAMPEIIREIKARSPDTVVMVGGAPLDRTLAVNYGADGYAETAVTVLEETEQAINRVRKGAQWLP
jgi:methylmalonyl-CoA mutase cobalamin-binding domain/chain